MLSFLILIRYGYWYDSAVTPAEAGAGKKLIA